MTSVRNQEFQILQESPQRRDLRNHGDIVIFCDCALLMEMPGKVKRGCCPAALSKRIWQMNCLEATREKTLRQAQAACLSLACPRHFSSNLCN